jgi:hypothetical protein
MHLNHKLVAAFGLVGLLAGGGAQAAGLVAAGNAFHISGSTALDNQVKDALLLGGAGVPAAQQTCQAGTISVYTDAPVVAGGNLTKSHQATVVCALNNAIGGLTAGTVVSFTKESNGGSNEGTYYPATQQTLAFFDATQAPVGCAAGIAIAAGHYWTHQQAFTEFDACTGPIVQIIPDVGLADEDPALFTIGPQAVTPAIIAALNTTPLFQNQFAVAVSLNLYRALQTQQGLVTGDDTLANMPSLTKAQISALYAGYVSNWNQIVSPTGAALASKAVFTCRRGDNSGTNVSADTYFLKNRCETASPPMVQVTTVAGNCTGLAAGQTPENNGCTWNAVNLADAVFGGAAGGDVASCLDAHARNGDYAFGHLGATSKFDDPNGATGAGTEAGTNHWRYIAIGGNKPTVEAMANGNYDYAFDNVENLWTHLAGNPLAVGTYVGTLFQSAIALTDILVAQPNAKSSGVGNPVDTNYITGGLQDGFVAASLNALPVTAAEITANPASNFTYASSGTVNNCQVPLTAGPSVTHEVY